MSGSASTQDQAGFGAASEMFTKMWSDFASKMAAAGMAPPTADGGADMAKQMRETFFNAWAEACDRYMRSEEFHQMMRESMSAAIELRKQLNEQMGDFQHTMQGASRQDVDRLLHSIDNLEQRVNETFEQLMHRLDSLSGRIDAIESNGRPRNKSTAKKSKASKKTSKKKTSKKTGAKSKSKAGR